MTDRSNGSEGAQTGATDPFGDRPAGMGGDQAFRKTEIYGAWPEQTYAGVTSFLRRRYSRELAGVDVAVCGIPYDCAVTNRPGTRFGPRAIRAASAELASMDAFPFGFDLYSELAIVDYGDFVINPHDPLGVPDAITEQAATIVRAGTRLLALGGDHFTTWPVLRAHAERFGPLGLVQFDAHSDTWEDDGTTLNHGTMFARGIAEGVIDPARSIQVGIRSTNYDQRGVRTLTGPWVHRNGIDDTIAAIHEQAGQGPVYLTFDIDVLDPAFAPGTGTPVSGGLAAWQALEILRGLTGLEIVGADVVEVSPPYDHAEITALAAATVAHDILCLWAQRKRSGEARPQA